MEGAVFTRCCETSGWHADCASVFFSRLCKGQLHQASQGAVPVVSWPFSELGYLEGSFRDEASFLAFLRRFNFWTMGQLKVCSAQFCWHFGFARLRVLLCAFHAVCFGNYTFFQWQGRLPPAATKPGRSIASFTVESLLRSAAVKLPAPGNKSDTGEDGCHFEACNSSASPQCWARCAPQGLLLLWGAFEGLGRLSSLRGKPFHRPPGQTCLQDKAQIGTPWTQVQKSRPTFSVPIRCLPRYGSMLHLGTVAKRTRLLCDGCRAMATARSLLSCYRRGQAVVGVTAHVS